MTGGPNILCPIEWDMLPSIAKEWEAGPEQSYYKLHEIQALS